MTLLALLLHSGIAGQRPEFPVATPEPIKVIIQAAWTRHSHERLTLEEFHSKLNDVVVRIHNLHGLTTTIVDVL